MRAAVAAAALLAVLALAGVAGAESFTVVPSSPGGVPSAEDPNAPGSIDVPFPLSVSPEQPAVRSYDELLALWHRAGDAYGIPWQVLGAINKVESDFGHNMGPSSAGAVGWMQFMPDTWMRWGLDATQRASYRLDRLPANTWQAGWDRVLVGVAMAEEGQRLFEGVLPLDDVGSGDIDLAGRFAEVLQRLRATVDAFAVAMPLDCWAAAVAICEIMSPTCSDILIISSSALPEAAVFSTPACTRGCLGPLTRQPFSSPLEWLRSWRRFLWLL